MINFKGETYRDDRLFVLNLTHGKEEEKSKWILVTYRNTIELPVYKTNCFDTKEDAIQYLKKVEQFTPLISNNEQPLEIAESAISDWDYYNNWLKQNNLFSAISEKQHCPFWRNNKGWEMADELSRIAIDFERRLLDAAQIDASILASFDALENALAIGWNQPDPGLASSS